MKTFVNIQIFVKHCNFHLKKPCNYPYKQSSNVISMTYTLARCCTFPKALISPCVKPGESSNSNTGEPYKENKTVLFNVTHNVSNRRKKYSAHTSVQAMDSRI